MLHNYVQQLQCDSDTTPWLTGLVETLGIRRDGHWLSLGCGSAEMELLAATEGLFSSMDAFDAAEASIEQARANAAEANRAEISFGLLDLNRPTLKRATYDVAMMCMSLHHVENLEGLLDGISESLRPSGVLLFNEYVGPNQLQFSETRMEIVSRLLRALPKRMTKDVDSGLFKESYVVQPQSYWNEVDPSEAVRSEEILGLVEERFEIIHQRDYGGTLLGPMLENIVYNFDPEDEKDQSLVRLLGCFEQMMIEHRVVTNDFTVVAARPRTAGVRRTTALEAEVAKLRRQVVERDRILSTVFASRSWRGVQAVRRLLGRK